MKIKFFRTIWWKLLVSYLCLIMITTAISYILTTATFRTIRIKERQMEIEMRVERIARIICESCKGDDKIENIKGKFKEIARISGIPLQLLNPGGKVVAFSRSSHPRFRQIKNINLQPFEMRKLREGKKFSSTRYYGENRKKLHYFICPIYREGDFKGSLVTAVPLGLPSGFAIMLLNSVLIATIIAFILAVFMSRSFTRPIRRMGEAARSMAQGDFTHKMKLNRKDELGILADAFDEMSSQLKKNIESRMKLMGDISHDLSTPLTTIRASAEAIHDGVIDTEEGRNRYLESILNQTRRLSFLINDITELSKFEAGEVKINKTLFDVMEPVQRAVESAGFLARKKDMQIEIFIEDENLQALGDAEKILQAIQNLINNAVQHNPPGTKIRISATKEEKKVLFSVEDNGQGIPEEEIENIFDRFHKVDKARTSGDSGSGLGLAIVEEILKAHGEEIFVTSSHKGSRFFFYLPGA